jgi:hypothetical protein
MNTIWKYLFNFITVFSFSFAFSTFSSSHSFFPEPGEHTRYSDWLRAGRPRGRSSSPGRVKNFLFSKLSRPALGSTQPPIQCAPGVLSHGVKQPDREADHSPPASADVKKMWIYTSTSHTP